MSATYWVLVADELLETMDPSLLPEGLRLAMPLSPLPDYSYIGEPPDSHWQRFTDDGAPEELDGKRVELTLGRQGRMPAKAVIIERRVVA